MITVKRKKGIDDDIPYIIVVDGNDMGEVKAGEEKKLRLRSNSYKIWIEAYYEGVCFKSKEIPFNIQKEDVVFICRSKYLNNSISKYLHREVFKDGISLKKEKC